MFPFIQTSIYKNLENVLRLNLSFKSNTFTTSCTKQENKQGAEIGTIYVQQLWGNVICYE